MLPKQPRFEPDEPASPALTRRRHQLLGAAPEDTREPRLTPLAEEAQPSLLPHLDEPAPEAEPDPEIPPSPGAATPRTAMPAAERIYRNERRRGGPLLAVVATGAVVILGGSAWLLYNALASKSGGGGGVPYVAADSGPEKVRPQQEGGMQVPNQDIRVYNEMNGAQQPKEPEVLLPQPEAPMTPPAATNSQPPANPDQTTKDTAGIPVVPAPSLDLQPAAGTTTPSTQTTEASGQGDTANRPAKTPSAPAATAETSTQTAAVNGAFRVQLAAVKSSDAAAAAWKKLAKAYREILKGLKLDVMKVDRGADGILYRVQVGPFADRAEAEQTCGRLKEKGQACLVVAP